jgi:hypothetical protein
MAVNPDFRDLFAALNDAGTKYLLVGGCAVSFHAEPRFTKDLDIARAAFVNPFITPSQPHQGLAHAPHTHRPRLNRLSCSPVRSPPPPAGPNPLCNPIMIDLNGFIIIYLYIHSIKNL